jgi:hypothetical protein
MCAIYVKKVSVGSFLKKGIDFRDSEMVEIMNEGTKVEGQFGSQDIFIVKTADGKEGNVSFNQTTINGLIDAFSDDSLKWIGQKVKAIKIKQNVAGRFVDVWYFSHPKAELTENGFVLEGTPSVSDVVIHNTEIPNDDIPVINEEEIDVKDILF